VRDRSAGSFCREIVDAQVVKGQVVTTECGAALKAFEHRKGLSVVVKGKCSEGHTFSRAGYAADHAEEIEEV
jgi:hypothetical protein